MRSAGRGASRPISTARTSYASAGIRRALAHSISAARSRTARYRYPPGRFAASGARSGAFEARISGASVPCTRGQKCRSCRSAAAWKVAAVTPRWPRSASRPAIAPAAFSVKVTTRMSRGRTTPVARAHATRREMTRVLPEPAPARMHSGPDVIVTAARWSGSRSARSVSGSTAIIRANRSGPGCTRDHPAILAGVELRGRFVTLRPAVPDDAPALAAILAEPEVAAWWGRWDVERVSSDLFGPDPEEEPFVI